MKQVRPFKLLAHCWSRGKITWKKLIKIIIFLVGWRDSIAKIRLDKSFLVQQFWRNSLISKMRSLWHSAFLVSVRKINYRTFLLHNRGKLHVIFQGFLWYRKKASIWFAPTTNPALCNFLTNILFSSTDASVITDKIQIKKSQNHVKFSNYKFYKFQQNASY